MSGNLECFFLPSRVSKMLLWVPFSQCPYSQSNAMEFFLKKLLLFNYSCLHFLPIPPPHPSQSHLPPPPLPSPLILSMCPYSSSCKPLSQLSPPHSPLAIVTLFLISMSLVIFYLLFSFVEYVLVKGEIIWYLSLIMSAKIELKSKAVTRYKEDH